jgi:hypothetical protein
VVYTTLGSGPRQLFRRAADATGQPQPLTDVEADLSAPTSFSSDGQLLVLGRRGDIGTLDLRTKSGMVPLLREPFTEGNGEISPDGRWIAYESNESGRFEVYVRPFPNVDGSKVQVSVDGGREASWNRRGGELFYLALDGGLMAVPFSSAQASRPGAPRKLFDTMPPPSNPARIYDATRDGQRFIVLKNADVPVQFSVVVNWGDEVRAALGAP